MKRTVVKVKMMFTTNLNNNIFLRGVYQTAENLAALIWCVEGRRTWRCGFRIIGLGRNVGGKFLESKVVPFVIFMLFLLGRWVIFFQIGNVIRSDDNVLYRKSFGSPGIVDDVDDEKRV